MLTEFIMYQDEGPPERFFTVEKLIAARQQAISHASLSGRLPPRIVIAEPLNFWSNDTLRLVLKEQGYTDQQLDGLGTGK